MEKRTWKALTCAQANEVYGPLATAIESIYKFVDFIADRDTRDWVVNAASDLTDLMVDLHYEPRVPEGKRD